LSIAAWKIRAALNACWQAVHTVFDHRFDLDRILLAETIHRRGPDGDEIETKGLVVGSAKSLTAHFCSPVKECSGTLVFQENGMVLHRRQSPNAGGIHNAYNHQDFRLKFLDMLV
jgi:hypothetical protein